MAVVYQIERRGARPRAKKFFGGVENVANVEMLPVPMLPMDNGTRAGPWDVRSSFAVRYQAAGS